jgi:Xaa-Pro aminopeptidase
MNETAKIAPSTAIPFDAEKLDDLLARAGIDALIVSSKHNIQHLLGGYRFFFFQHFDAIGLGKYVPLLVYERGHPERTRYIGNSMERYERDLGTLWAPELVPAWYGPGGMRAAVEHLKRLGLEEKTIGIEPAFLGADAADILRAELPRARLVDALIPLERFRAVKSPEELEYLKKASEHVVESMLAVIAAHGPGSSTREIAEALRQEEVLRGLEFDYCLITAGKSHNRAPSDRLIWNEGDVLSVDSGGNCKGYIGDLCRMGIMGEPDDELEELLGEIDEIQQAARKPIRAGALGREVIAAGEAVVRRSPHANRIEFVAHGMGLVAHEAPRLMSNAPVPYAGDDGDKPLEAGMVLSIETTHPHPRGFIKLEDTVIVTATGWEPYGDQGRGWNRGGTAI